MAQQDQQNLPGDGLERFLTRVGRFAEKAGRPIPRLEPGADPAEVRRTAARLRRHELPPPRPDITHEQAAEILELAAEQEEIIRSTAGEMSAERTLYHEMLRREAEERDVTAFHALKAEASRQGGDQALLRELNRARRAAGGRGRGRR